MVAEQLPDALNTVLPDMLVRMLRVRTSPLPSQAIPSTLDPMSAIHRLVTDHMTTHADEIAKQVTSETLEHARGLRDEADVDFEERLQDHRLEIAILKEDLILEMQIFGDEKLEQFKENITKLLEEENDEIVEACITARDELNELVRRRKLKLLRKLFRLEFEPLQPHARGLPRSGLPRARAKSVPSEFGW